VKGISDTKARDYLPGSQPAAA